MNIQESSLSTETKPGSTHLPCNAPKVIVFPPVLLLGAAVVGGAVQWFWPIHISAHAWVRSAVGAGLALLGGSLVIVSNITLRRAGTTVDPSGPTTTIVQDGVFRFTRNPMYLGGTLAYIGFALVLNSIWPLVALIPSLALLHWGVVLPEENYLEQKFGPAYSAYRDRVRRWL
jgi:protein-S-isoprenylcysteine O-methyltransferase Ste14